MGFKPLLAVLTTLLAGIAPAQQFPEMPTRDEKDPAARDAVKARLDAARAAVAAKDRAAATRHFANALWWNPFAAAILGEIVDLQTTSPDARALWTLRLAYAAMDERGALDADGPFKKHLKADPALAKLCAARAEAVIHLLAAQKDLRGKDGDAAVVAHWSAALAHDLLAGAPALGRRHGPAFNHGIAGALPDYKPVIAALKDVMDRALGEQKPGLAIRAAQCLLGLAAQSRFKDLEGPRPPPLDAVAMAARAALARAREQIETRRKGAITTIDELEAMSPEERDRFTRTHASFDDPGVTLSPKGLYRVETTCGHATLLGVAKTVELHHARLARHFGQDPFGGQQGIVRVVPESAGLEGEGTPYWWAGGFQSGAVTTLKFSCGTIRGFGHGLTHELTHRFDGALNPGIPAWLAEGRAVWTGAAFGNPEDEDFVANHASFGTVEDAFIKGYGGEENFKKLVLGTIDDYRHNYTAGYALYLFLATWRDGDAPLFAERLARFERGCKEKGGNSLEWFAATFCDGKGGRPKDLKDMAAKFGEFVKGFYWQHRAPWTSRYTEKTPPSSENPFVYDAPTWHQDRNRAEPWFGQDQARIAAEVLLEAGRTRDAAAAFVWSLAVDEWRIDAVSELARLLDRENRATAAWALRNEAARRFGGAPHPGPLPPDLARAAAKAIAYADLLAATARAAAPSLPIHAAALRCDHDRLARHLGMRAAAALPAESPAPEVAAAIDAPPRSLGLFGWEEDKLTGYEERRAKDLWYDVPEGDLHVGRHRPREGTGTMDRAAHQRDAFARTREWIPAGRYVVTARIQVTTSYVSGALVLGFTRRDRNVRLHFSGGDFLYSIGAKDEKTQFESVHANLHGLRERDGPLWGSNPGRTVKFPAPTNAFTLRVCVDGPQAVAWVDDEIIGTYHTTDGQAIEGFVGFAAGQGAYLAASPTIERRDRGAALQTDPSWPRGLDPARPGTQKAREIQNLASRGIPVDAAGALVLWIPDLTTTDGREPLAIDVIAMVNGAAIGLDHALADDGHETTFSVYVPERVPEDVRNSIEADLKFHVRRATALRTHRHAASLTTFKEGASGAEEPTPTVLYLDPMGVVRVADRFQTGQRSLSGHLHQWLSVFEAIAASRRSPTDSRKE